MINKVILVGNLGRDAELRALENGGKVSKFSLATNENYQDKNGEWQTITEWHNITAWGRLAERTERLSKGMLVYVEGKLTHRKYVDKNGIEKYATDVVANSLKVLHRPQQSQSGLNIAVDQKDDSISGVKDMASGLNTTVDANNQDDDLPF